MRIFNFEDFIINELQKFVSDRTQSGKTKWIDWIYDDPSSSKSQSASILLKKKYLDLEDKEIEDIIGKKPDWVKRRLKSNPTKYNKLLVTLNNLKFLKDKIKEGLLYCEYCSKGPLVIYDFDKGSIEKGLDNPNIRFNTKFNADDGATCDHKVPQSKGGDKFDYSNLAVSCHRCNRKKGNMDYNDWMIFLDSEIGRKWLSLSDNKKVNKEIKDINIPIESSFKRFTRNYNESDIKVGDEVWIRGIGKRANKYLGIVSEILPNEKHPNKEISAKIKGKDPNSLWTLSRLVKF